MKVIYYRALIKGTNKLTPDEKILYSFLVSKSITDCNDLFNSDGLTINKDALYDCDDYIELKEMNNSKISRELGITRQSIINAKQKLLDNYYIIFGKHGNAKIFAPQRLFVHGYFELQGIGKLRGDLLVFYSYLLDKSKKYNYCIDTFKYRLAEDLGKTKVSITKLLNRLYEKGYAERLKDGRLKINLTPQEND